MDDVALTQMTMAYLRRKRFEARIEAGAIMGIIGQSMQAAPMPHKAANAADLALVGLRVPEGF